MLNVHEAGAQSLQLGADLVSYELLCTLLRLFQLSPQGSRQMLLLLATYMHARAGQEDQAIACAQRLADVANDAIAAAYAQFVLTGQRPDEQSAQPAN